MYIYKNKEKKNVKVVKILAQVTPPCVAEQLCYLKALEVRKAIDTEERQSISSSSSPPPSFMLG